MTDYLAILAGGVEGWNAWRDAHPAHVPDLSEASLRDRDLTSVNLTDADLRKADLTGATLAGASLSHANLAHATLSHADLTKADLSHAFLEHADLSRSNFEGAYAEEINAAWAHFGEAKLDRAVLRHAHFYNCGMRGASFRHADLTGANLRWTNLRETVFTGATLREAKLGGAVLIDTDLQNADLTGSYVHGLSAWDVNLSGAIQRDLVITNEEQAAVTVDDLEVAHFMYILLTHQRLRHVIDTITSKVVLILGRFTPERKIILDALRQALRDRNYTPILFDFERPSNRDLTETVSTLAHLARFIIADLTDARSIPQELHAIVPHLPSVAVQPVLLASQHEYGMFEHFRRFPSVLEPYLYQDQQQLLATLDSDVIDPAESQASRLTSR